MATLQQRLFPLSGQATLADIPWLYGRLSAGRQRAAQAMQGGAGTQGMRSQQLPALSGGGATSIGAPIQGRPTPTMPAVEAISRPGGYGASGLGMGDDRGRSEGGGYGGGNILAESDRYTDMARRGTAPLTGEGLLAALQNAAGLIQDPISMGIGSIAELSGNPIPGMPGIQTIPGYRKIQGTPRTLQEYLDAMNRALAGPSERIGDRLAGRNVPDRIENVVSGGWVDAATGARMRGNRSSFGVRGGRFDPRSGRDMGGGTGNRSVAGGRSVGGLAVGSDGRIAGGI